MDVRAQNKRVSLKVLFVFGAWSSQKMLLMWEKEKKNKKGKIMIVSARVKGMWMVHKQTIWMRGKIS